MKRIVLAVLLAALAGSAAAATVATQEGSSFTPYDRDSAAASQAQ